MRADDVIRALDELADPGRKEKSAKYLKAVPGGYGEGDEFVGVKVPDQRKVARAHRGLALSEIRKLLQSTCHEHRFTGFLILMDHYRRGDDQARRGAYDLCIEELAGLNNWDLVDTAVPAIIGEHMRAFSQETHRLEPWARSENLWHRRIAMLATRAFIIKGEYEHALTVARLLLHDKHDLIHKAVGWMLREIGEHNLAVEEAFLDQHHATMPRTMLRYAVEKFSPERRAHYMKR